MTSLEHVIRIDRSDSDGDFIVMKVSSNGPEPLDLHIHATEGQNPYATDINSSRISNLREKRSVQTNLQWEQALLTTLLQRPTTSIDGDQNANERIETVAFLSSSRITLIFRRNISGITQRLGEITLHQDDDIEIDPQSWTSVAISRGDALQAQVSDLIEKHASAQETISNLSQQLEELITTKQSHENILLSKFQILLNAKKVKIREQQRLLAQANIRGPTGRVQATTKKEHMTGAVGKPSESRRGKRKADEAALSDGHERDEEEEAAFEGPASSTRVKDEDADEVGDGMLQTPDASDEDITEDEDEGGQDERGKSRNVGDTSGSQRMELDASSPSISDLPPDRELPFESTMKKQNEPVQKQQQHVAEEDQETDDDDDEL